MKRQRFALLLAVVLMLAGTTATPALSAALSAAPITLTLPAPTGPFDVGTVSLHLIDASRTDPWVPEHPPREMMISIWYPSLCANDFPLAPWLAPAAAAEFARRQHLPAELTLPMTHGHIGAPVWHPGHGNPVVLYSPGSGLDRAMGTNLAEELASHGYMVVTIDHTHDAEEVEFPGGRVEVSTVPEDTPETTLQMVAVREADTRFVLDQLTAVNAGVNPDAEQRPLPQGLRGAADLGHVGMFGHSMGGATAAATMLDDPRVLAGVNMDGTVRGKVLNAGLDRPFMLVGADGHDRTADQSWATFWAHLRGWRLEVNLTGTQHLSFTDAEVLYPQAASTLGLTPEQLAALIGTLDPQRAITIQRTYLRAFFDLHLRARGNHLLDAPSPRYPEVRFISA